MSAHGLSCADFKAQGDADAWFHVAPRVSCRGRGRVRRGRFDGAVIANLIANIVFSAVIFFMALYLQVVEHQSPLRAGMLLLPATIPILLANPIGTRLGRSRGAWLPTAIGMALAEDTEAVKGPLLLGLVLIVAGLEVIRQIHYVISEHSDGWHMFWDRRVFGGWERFMSRRNPWQRYRLQRLVKWLVFLVIVSLLLSWKWNIRPLSAFAQAPGRLFNNLFGAPSSNFPLAISLLLRLLSGGSTRLFVFYRVAFAAILIGAALTRGGA